MFYSNLEQIKAEARQRLSGKDAQALTQLWDEIYCAFKTWKQEHGDRDRKPRPARGLLDILPDKPLPFKKAEPWECADFIMPNPIALARKLWLENYAPFKAIMDREGFGCVLALLTIKFADTANPDDLLAVHDHFVMYESIVSGIAAGRRSILQLQENNLEKGRLKGAQTQKEAAAERDKEILNMNADLLNHSNTARWKLEQRAAYIRDRVFKNEETKKKYSIGTIIGKIQGQA